jgi:hypothetical protein
MKGLSIFALATSVLALGCGGEKSSSSGSPAGPSGGPSDTTYTLALSPANENPPVTGPDANISATARITISAVKDGSGNVTSATASFQVNGTGFPAGTTITGAHIHAGGSAVNGGIVCNTGITSADMPISNGTGTATRNGVAIGSDIAQALLKNPENFYFNLHTANSPDGAVRSQIAAGGDPGSPGGPGPIY